MAFTHLHVHTSYSLLDGSNKIKEYVSRIKELGMTAAAITDHGVMYGCVDFYKECKAQGIKPVIGCEVYVAPGSRFDKNGGASDDKYYHLILLAENDLGYKNLMKIVSTGFVEGYYYKPRVDKEILEKYHEGIIASSACLAGEIPRNILGGNYDKAKEVALWYRETFGENNFFLELMDHGIMEQKHVNAQLKRMSAETGIPLICTNDVHYTYANDVEAHDILLCIQTNKHVADEDRMRYEGGQYFVKSEEEMRELFSDTPEALENTARIAERCNVEIVFHEKKLPKFDVPEGREAYEYLCELCNKGLYERYDNVTPELQERLDYELSTIKDMGYVDYFLIVWDFIKYARDNDIMVGPGRGSAAGSIVSYTLGITMLDPIKYNLLFERFLNPERVTMPDIDVDFCFERRQEVIDYVVRKYGKERVVQIITFGTMAAKGVIRDVGRVLDMPYAEVDVIAKMIPNELNMTIDRALEMNPELKAQYESDERIKYLIDMSKRLEGLPRQTSMHAAGVLICDNKVDEYVPLSLSKDGMITTQYTMGTLEELGLLKMDFLGLRTLTVIQQAERLVNAGDSKLLDINNIDYNDKNVLQLIAKGNTLGVFQLESEGMKNFMKELKPDSLEDIIAGISLYRPGPMDFIPKYIAGKQDPSLITYDCPEIKPILEPTYGCIVYQEQVMQIVRDLGGYTLGRSDLVRRAMSKKKADVMAKERLNFVYGNKEEGVPGCISRGIPENVANKIFDDMTDFAKYAFNKSHAAAYAYVAFQTAYLKCYHPVEFMAALMTSVIDNPTKCAEYILSCHDLKIEILPPSINSGEGRFTVENGAIRYGLYAIKNVGRSAADAIAEERKAHGPYESIADFLKRTSGRDINKRTVENLIKAGALDEFSKNRRALLQIYPMVMEDVDREIKESVSGQMNLFDFMAPEERAASTVKIPDVQDFSKEEKLSNEKEVLGIYLSGHPLDDVEALWRKQITATSGDFVLKDEADETGLINGEGRIIGGLIADKKIKYTRNNKIMAFITIEDLVGQVEVLVFPKIYERFSALLIEDSKVFVEGRVSAEEEKDSKLIADRIWTFDDVSREIWIAFDNKKAYLEKCEALKEILAGSQGKDTIAVYLRQEKAVKHLTKVKCGGDQVLIDELERNFGRENVAIK